jgi:hypothetical protein
MDIVAAKKAEQLTEAKMRRSYDTAVINTMKRDLSKYAKANR